MALTTDDLVFGAPMTSRQLDWLVRATRIAVYGDVENALMRPVSQTARDQQQLWLEDIYGSYAPQVSKNEVCKILENLSSGVLSTPSVSLEGVDHEAIRAVLLKLNCATTLPSMRWTHREIRMLRFAINEWRRGYGFEEVEGSDGDAMAKNWLVDRNERDKDPELPSEDELCITLENIYDFRNRFGHHISELEDWRALREKICGHGLDLNAHDRDIIRQSIHQSWLNPGVRIDVDHWVVHERSDLCEILHERLTHGQISDTLNSEIRGVLEKLGCPPPPDPGEVYRERKPSPEQEPERVVGRGTITPLDAALSPFELNLVAWMLQQKWHTERNKAIAHVIRLRKAGVIEEWKKRGKKNLNGLEMVETLRRYQEST